MKRRPPMTSIAVAGLVTALLLGAVGCSGGATGGSAASGVGASSASGSAAGSAATAAGAASASQGAAATAALPENGAEVDAAAFTAAVAQAGTVILDVRTPEEFASGHLPGARNIDINGGTFSLAVGQLPKGTAYAVYCRSGNRSGTAVSQMVDQGFTRVFHLAGGIGAWQSAGGQVVTG